MGKEATQLEELIEQRGARVRERPPRPSPQFRRRAWLAFQRALDPLAPPRPLKAPRQH